MQRADDESRQVRKEATAVDRNACRGKPGPRFSDRYPAYSVQADKKGVPDEDALLRDRD